MNRLPFDSFIEDSIAFPSSRISSISKVALLQSVIEYNDLFNPKLVSKAFQLDVADISVYADQRPT